MERIAHMNIAEDFEDIRDEVEEILDYSGFFKPAEGHIWQIEDDDSHLNDDGGSYAMWLDLSNTDAIYAGTKDLFVGSEREPEERTFEVFAWRGWSGTVAEAVEWLSQYGLSPDIAGDVIGDLQSICEDID